MLLIAHAKRRPNVYLETPFFVRYVSSRETLTYHLVGIPALCTPCYLVRNPDPLAAAFNLPPLSAVLARFVLASALQ